MRVTAFFQSWFASAPRRRRHLAEWEANGAIQDFEVLEVRIALTDIEPGTYAEPFKPEGEGAELLVREDGTGEYFSKGLGRFAVKIHNKKNGTVVVKSISPGIHGKLTLTPFGTDGYDAQSRLHSKEVVDFSEPELIKIADPT
jgi:hypothetical protein